MQFALVNGIPVIYGGKATRAYPVKSARTRLPALNAQDTYRKWLVTCAGVIRSHVPFMKSPFDSREVLATNTLLHKEMLKEFAEIFAGRV